MIIMIWQQLSKQMVLRVDPFIQHWYKKYVDLIVVNAHVCTMLTSIRAASQSAENLGQTLLIEIYSDIFV